MCIRDRPLLRLELPHRTKVQESKPQRVDIHLVRAKVFHFLAMLTLVKVLQETLRAIGKCSRLEDAFVKLLLSLPSELTSVHFDWILLKNCLIKITESEPASFVKDVVWFDIAMCKSLLL